MLKELASAIVPRHPLRRIRRLYDATVPERKADRMSNVERGILTEAGSGPMAIALQPNVDYFFCHKRGTDG